MVHHKKKYFFLLCLKYRPIVEIIINAVRGGINRITTERQNVA
jgi:hypothetical protein